MTHHDLTAQALTTWITERHPSPADLERAALRAALRDAAGEPFAVAAPADPAPEFVDAIEFLRAPIAYNGPIDWRTR